MYSSGKHSHWRKRIQFKRIKSHCIKKNQKSINKSNLSTQGCDKWVPVITGVVADGPASNAGEYYS
jgi:hypothetical protein